MAPASVCPYKPVLLSHKISTPRSSHLRKPWGGRNTRVFSQSHSVCLVDCTIGGDRRICARHELQPTSKFSWSVGVFGRGTLGTSDRIAMHAGHASTNCHRTQWTYSDSTEAQQSRAYGRTYPSMLRHASGQSGATPHSASALWMTSCTCPSFWLLVCISPAADAPLLLPLLLCGWCAGGGGGAPAPVFGGGAPAPFVAAPDVLLTLDAAALPYSDTVFHV